MMGLSQILGRYQAGGPEGHCSEVPPPHNTPASYRTPCTVQGALEFSQLHRPDFISIFQMKKGRFWGEVKLLP